MLFDEKFSYKFTHAVCTHCCRSKLKLEVGGGVMRWRSHGEKTGESVFGLKGFDEKQEGDCRRIGESFVVDEI